MEKIHIFENVTEKNKFPSNLLICDDENTNLDSNLDNDLIYWSSYAYSESKRIFSIPQIVENQSDYLKEKYLKLIYQFGKLKINGKSIVGHFKIRQNFSYWWLTLLTGKSNCSKSPQINNVVKLMALEYWLKENKYTNVRLISEDEYLSEAIFLLTKKLSISYEFKKTQSKKNKISLINKIYYYLPNIVSTPIWLVYYLFSNWSLKGVGIKKWRESVATTTFISYFLNLVKDPLLESEYESLYWTKLTRLLKKEQHDTNWLHIYINDNLLSPAKSARKSLIKFNSLQNTNQIHVCQLTFLSIPLVVKTLKDWLRILRLKSLVGNQLQIESDYYWPLFKQDYNESITGVTAITNLLNFNLFERAMVELPAQNRGCYLQENQGWEFSFIYNWKSAGHADNLVGYPHSTVKYWDLRYFYDPKSYQEKDQDSLPVPSYVGVNGDVAKNFYINGGYPVKKLRKFEALRYLYVSDSIANRKNKKDINKKEKIVLVVGDILRKNTDLQINTLKSAQLKINQSTKFIIKPHPACPINIEDYPGLFGEISFKPISDLIAISDLVYSSSTTSAAVDAFCVGLPIISILDGKSLNLSPLKNDKTVYFITNSEELAIAINDIKEPKFNHGKDYFYLDNSLPSWREWLTSSSIKN